MIIVVSGASGLVGSALVSFLTSHGHTVKKLVRRPSDAPDEIQWDPETGVGNKSKLNGCHVVVHLAGESIDQGRWNSTKKERIRDSRVKGTTFLTQALTSLSNRPQLFICASASGYYGDRGEEILREDALPGNMFLSQVCQEWEAATASAAEAGIRVVNLRSGIILSPTGAALKKMLTPFKLGLGGRIASGNQYWSWIAIDDVVGVIDHAIRNESLKGPVNTSTPNPVTNAEFTETLAKVLHRPAIFPIPKLVLRTVFGEMADELLLCSFRMEPSKLIADNYVFRFPDLESALLHLSR